jgi:dsDNA-specific endonuclease/ATPase MutS2
MATTVERLGIVETKVENLNEKLDDIKTDVKEMHDCLDKTRAGVMSKLDEMYGASCSQHDQLAKKITELEKIKTKYTTYAMMTLAFIAGAGWIGNPNMSTLLKFVGL